MKKVSPVIWGIAIIALGVILGGNAIGLFNINVFFDGWWTLFIIVPSAVSFITEKDKLSSLMFLAIGIIFLLAAQNVFSYDVAWKVALAVFLVAVGLGIIFKSVFHSNSDKELEKKIREFDNDKVMDSQSAIFSGSERVYNDETFAGTNLLAVFGGVDLDLRKAKFTKDTVIRAFCLFGGIDLKVPEGAQVKIRSRFIFGGASDERKGSTGKGKYMIYLDAVGGFGGINIIDKEKKS